MKPTTYIILFRGVGGKTQLPTKPLREKLAEAGFENIATYINSGNAILRTGLNPGKILTVIAELCRTAFAFDKAIFAATREEWQVIIADNPFADVAASAPTTVHAALLEKKPTKENVDRIRALAVEGEDMQVIGRAAYLHTPHGFGRSKMAEKFDAWIGVPNTARNWNTVVKLSALAQAAAG